MKPILPMLAVLVLLTSACQTNNAVPTPGDHPAWDASTPDTITTGLAPTQLPMGVSATADPSPTVTATVAPTESSTPERVLPLLRPQYRLHATLDYSWRYLSVQQEITIPNTSSNSLGELVLVVQPNWRPGVFNLLSLTWEDGSQVTTYTLEGIRLRILLVEPFDPGDSLHLSLKYEINLPPLITSEDFGPSSFGYTARQINLTDWYPFIPPYLDGVGWQVHNPWFYGEHLVYPAADFEINLELLNAPETTLIAASALDLGDDALHYYKLEGARNFVFSVSPEYRRFQEQVGDTIVFGYAFPYDVIPGEAAFRTTVEALELYNQLFGPYPYQGLTMVQADFDHGMEYSGLYFLSKAFYSTYDGTPATYLVAIAAHETAHQWWYGLVGNDQALEPWLDEALCTYSEKLFYQNLYPEALSWWQSYRVDYYQPSGAVNSTIYNTPGYRPYRDAVYLNGANFLDDLRTLVGDQAFQDFLRDYLIRNAGQIATSNNFFTILREHSQADWEPLMSQYFESP
jgi:hypothetical protein